MAQFVINPEKLTYLGERQRQLIDFYNSGEAIEIVNVRFDGLRVTVNKFKDKCEKAGLRRPRLYVVEQDNQVFIVNADVLGKE